MRNCNDLIDWEIGIKREHIEKIIDLAKLTPVEATLEQSYRLGSYCGRDNETRIKINKNFIYS